MSDGPIGMLTDTASTLVGGAADFMTTNPAGMAISAIATGGMSGALGAAGTGVGTSLGQGAAGLLGGGATGGLASNGFMSGLSTFGNGLWDSTLGGLGTPTEAFPGAGLGSGATNYSLGSMASNLGSSIMSNPMGAINQVGKLSSMFGSGAPSQITPNIQNPGTGGSNQTTSSLNSYNWNNVPTSNNYTQGNMYSQLPTDINGKSILTDGKNQGNSSSTTQVSQPYGTYLGTL